MTVLRRFTNIVGCAGVLATLLVAGAACAYPPTYPLVCRSGGQMTLQIRVQFGSPIITLLFDKASVPGNPEPGQCVWLDRTLSPSEPLMVWYKLLSNDWVLVDAGYSNGSYALPGTTDPDVYQLTEMVPYWPPPDSLFILYVYNDGQGFTKPGRSPLE